VTNETLASRSETRKNREERKDGTVELPFNTRVEVECPVCGECFETTHLTGAADISISWGYCVAAECDTFLKFRRDRDAEEEEETPARRKSNQAGLTQFTGGESA